MATTYSVVVTERIGPIVQVSIAERPIPVAEKDEILVRLLFSGVCHGDVSLIYNDWDVHGLKIEGAGARVSGHEGVGVVVATGPEVDRFQVGDFTGVRWIYSVCGSCKQCIEGHDERCPNQIHSGRQINGSFQQYIVLPAACAPRIPSSIPTEHVGPLLCAGVTVYRSLKAAQVSQGDWIVILGAGGGLGHLGIQFAKAMSLRVIAIDTGVEKASVCQTYGADHFIDFAKTADVVHQVQSITEGGANGVIASVASGKAYAQGVAMLAIGGVLLCVGLPAEECGLPISIAECIGKSCRIIGVNAGSLADTEETLEYAAQHSIKVMTQVFPMSEADKVFQKVRDGNIAGRAVLDLSG